ncbi:1,4-alpha-glucan branching enzyme [Jeotgalibacillus terrae]|uniref:1,4-alpha-glucan branching enzyme GlgB n=1 Tax=Jeotgalibacillus terrae TaxID=587735 RepID=A0ABW5ZGX0_9BACL|nr:1,4-alpha-glucan branching enzyme [Jeotgalibacillus terrae]MBM7580404.1 1,4-alpha-glucan branching enzyme [Jeotgalibacillus terrae]
MDQTISDFDIHLFHEGTLYNAHHTFGAHLEKQKKKVTGTRFTVWAPHAQAVSVTGSFTNWETGKYEMTRVNQEGIWTCTIDRDLTGEMYKYAITTASGDLILKSDPYAFHSELRPQTASVVYDLSGYKWGDQLYRQRVRKRRPIYERPLSIYELHLNSWKQKEDGSYFTYREYADELIPYVKEHGFTHIELLPLTEHPLDASWGYQGTGYFSPTSRFGTPHDLMYLIDRCHQEDIGVLMDWVPGHFCKDSHGLYMFDGEPLYEYDSFNDRENHEWGTANFNLAKGEVRSFLISNALYWMHFYRIDGLRVDAVANIIYWANSEPETANPYATEFLQELNKAVFKENPRFLMMAEDSTDWPGVTKPVHEGGLGFNYKWNMGWMNDVLDYMEYPPFERRHHHHKLTFSLVYAYSENYILPLSHDEVVHGKRSLLHKMPGEYWEKFAQWRLLLSYLITHPGKKLLFMGGEFAQFDEWKYVQGLDWFLKDYDAHHQADHFSKELMDFYQNHKALHEFDHDPQGFEWIDADNAEQSIYSFIRKGKRKSDTLMVICNFTNVTYDHFEIGAPFEGRWEEVFSSDLQQFGGTNLLNQSAVTEEKPLHNKKQSLTVKIPPFGVTIWKPAKK